jgi:two-component system, NtrC family, response regulator HydG
VARILLVEDDTDVLLMLEHTLYAAGYEVDSVTTVAAAFSLLRRHSYELVLADGQLGDGTGMKLAERAVARGAKALIITGYAFTLPREELMRYPYLLKPVRPDELLAEIARVLSDR